MNVGKHKVRTIPKQTTVPLEEINFFDRVVQQLFRLRRQRRLYLDTGSILYRFTILVKNFLRTVALKAHNNVLFSVDFRTVPVEFVNIRERDFRRVVILDELFDVFL